MQDKNRNDAAGEAGEGFSKLEWIALAAFFALVAAALTFLPVREALEGAADWVGSLGWWAPAGFVAIYVLCALALIPRTILTVAAGMLFGMGWGLLWSLLAANLASSLAFLAARHFAHGAVSRRIRNHDRLDSLDRAVVREGWRIVALTRLSPVFPYSVLNYAYGLTRVRWSQFAYGTFVGMLPGFAMLVALGDLTGLAAEAGEEGSSPARTLALCLAAVAATVATILITRFAKQALRSRESA
jgi:uncharacterized membrane protein YdjX (TVP38/TMEM64 family)